MPRPARPCIYFGVGGPNFTSSFHVIGTIFDRVYSAASLVSPPLASVQTVSVPPGGATAVDLTLPVPGRYVLVDHALTRMERGLVGALIVGARFARDLPRARRRAGQHSRLALTFAPPDLRCGVASAILRRRQQQHERR
jgi:hypothetical protein